MSRGCEKKSGGREGGEYESAAARRRCSRL